MSDIKRPRDPPGVFGLPERCGMHMPPQPSMLHSRVTRRLVVQGETRRLARPRTIQPSRHRI